MQTLAGSENNLTLTQKHVDEIKASQDETNVRMTAVESKQGEMRGEDDEMKVGAEIVLKKLRTHFKLSTFGKNLAIYPFRCVWRFIHGQHSRVIIHVGSSMANGLF